MAPKRASKSHKKDINAPRRFKSAYIFFSEVKHAEIRTQLQREGRTNIKTTDVAKLVSKAWKNISPEARAKYEELARNDKKRFEVEKASYQGPWKVPNEKKKKDPNAPKRPASAFLSYANKKRAAVKQLYPTLNNGDLGRKLSSMWKELPDKERMVYIEEEKRLRDIYLKDMGEWKEKETKKNDKQRKEREERALSKALSLATADEDEQGSYNEQTAAEKESNTHHDEEEAEQVLSCSQFPQNTNIQTATTEEIPYGMLLAGQQQNDQASDSATGTDVVNGAYPYPPSTGSNYSNMVSAPASNEGTNVKMFNSYTPGLLPNYYPVSYPSNSDVYTSDFSHRSQPQQYFYGAVSAAPIDTTYEFGCNN